MKPHQKLQALIEEYKELSTKDAWTSEDEAREVELKAAIETAKSDVERENKRIAAKSASAAHQSYVNDPATDLPHDGTVSRKTAPAAAVKRGGTLKHFKGKDAHQQAYDFGMFALAALSGSASARDYCKKQGIPVRAYHEKAGTAHLENENTNGGILVPTQFDAEMIDLRETYGVFRRNTRIKTMSSDTLITPRRIGGLKAYPVGEGKTTTNTAKQWDYVELTARKWMVLSKMSSEVNEDAIIEFADDLAGEIGYAFAFSEDDAGFNGDGTSAYHRIVGLAKKLQGLSGTVANIAGIQVASGNSWSEFELADFNALKGRLPGYVFRSQNVKWFCSTAFYSGVMERLMLAAGGNTQADLVNGNTVFKFMGYPVEVTEAMPLSEANSQIACFLGDLRQATTFGDRRISTIMLSEHSSFEDDMIDIRGTERFDINVHDVGNASATANLRKAGPIVALQTAAS